MKITSSILPAEPLPEPLAIEIGLPPCDYAKPIVLMAFRSRIGRKDVLVGIGVGDANHVTPIANEVLARLERHAGWTEETAGNRLMALCTDRERAQALVKRALIQAKSGDMIMIMCANSYVYDGVKIIDLLNVQTEKF